MLWKLLPGQEILCWKGISFPLSCIIPKAEMILLKHNTLSHKSRSVNDLWIGIKQASKKILRWGTRMHVQLVCTSEVPIKKVWHEKKRFLLLLFFKLPHGFLEELLYYTEWLVGMCVQVEVKVQFSGAFLKQANRWRCQSRKTPTPGLSWELCMMGLQIRARED